MSSVATSNRQNGTDIVKHVFSWTSDGSGDASVSAVVSGEIQRVVIDPSASAAPTALYDMVLNDENSVDVLAGYGANLSATATTSVCPGTPLSDGTTTSVRPVVVDGTLTLVVSNAGDTKSGTVTVYVR